MGVASGATKFLNTGIPGLDDVLGGGFQERGLLLLFGPPGAGKTTLVFQMAFHAASAGRRVVYISTLAETASRLVEHIGTFSFWDAGLIGKRLFIESIYPLVRQGVAEVARALIDTVRSHGAQLLVLDGLMTIRDLHPQSAEHRLFIHEVSVALAALGCTAVVTTSEVPDMHGSTPSEFTMSDAIVELHQSDVHQQPARALRVWKNRGAPCALGSHAVRITARGLAVYPRIETRPLPGAVPTFAERLSSGQPELDVMMSGGLPRGSVTIVAGAPGTGKTLVMLQYLIEGARQGQKGLLVGFREPYPQLAARARSFGMDLEGPVKEGLITVLRHAPVDLVADEVLAQVLAEVERTGAARLGVDGLGELDHMIAVERRRRGVLASLTEFLRARGVTALFTREVGQVVGPELDFAGSPLDVLAENVIFLRYVEFRGALRRILSILKMRDTLHDHSIRQYEIGAEGIRVLSQVESAEGLLAAIARLPSERRVKRRGTAPGRREGKR
ncbi:ATPase domain-containing protein [Sorangium cellulosum]|uniref:ATPase domain-containing protein n=1 Tax=Sorangium cellulosum TaxID=56 RepID=UPI00133171BF|nr:ATPase domain-containing protein [Sorangium cellulosum]